VDLARWGTCALVKGKFSSVSEPSTSVEAITRYGLPEGISTFYGTDTRVSDGKEQCFGVPDRIQTAVANSIALDSREQYGASANERFFLTI
jgi:hypothetical protein